MFFSPHVCRSSVVFRFAKAFLCVGVLWSIATLHAEESPRNRQRKRPAAVAQKPAAEKKNVGQSAPDISPAPTNLPTPTPAPTSASPPNVEDPVLQEILQIRRQQGSVLKGSLLEKLSGESSDAAETSAFLETLRRLSSENSQRPATVTTPLDESVPRAPLPPAAFPESPLSIDRQLIQSLRAAARALEAKADEHEESRRFEEADRLRQLADQLRREARATETGSLRQP